MLVHSLQVRKQLLVLRLKVVKMTKEAVDKFLSGDLPSSDRNGYNGIGFGIKSLQNDAAKPFEVPIEGAKKEDK